MKKNIVIGLVTFIALVLVTSAAFAGPGWGRGQGYDQQYGCPLVSSLTPEQTSRIQTIQQANFQEISPLREQLYAKRTELRSLWVTQNPDQAKIAALQKDMLDIRAQLQEESNNARLEVRQVLTPEQQAQLGTYGSGLGRMVGRMGRW